MKRVRIKEFHETKYCPAAWRDLTTDFLSFFVYHANPYRTILPVLRNAIESSNCKQIVDFASGNGTYMLKILKNIDPEHKKYNVLLSDKFPNSNNIKRIEELSEGRIKYIPESVDLLTYNRREQGFRTLFSGAHHFDRDELKTFIRNAVENKCGIAIFEYSSRGIMQAILPSLMVPFLVLMLTPLVSPFSWKRLFWTYIIPAVPFLMMIDGFISHLKSYSVDELKAIISELKIGDYHFECRRQRVFLKTCPVTYLIAYPENIT